MTDLAARATRLGPAFDLLAGYREGGFFLERAGLGLSTIGEADRVTAEPGPERILRLSRALIDILAPGGELVFGAGGRRLDPVRRP